MDRCDSAEPVDFRRGCPFENISRHQPERIAVPLYGYFTPLIVAITIVTNTLIVVVLSHRHLRTPTNTVLLAMAVAELMTGLSSAPWLLYYYSFKGYVKDKTEGISPFWCHYHDYFATNLPTIFHTAAVWLTVYLAVQRYVYVCVPKLVPRLCTLCKTRAFIVSICLLAILSESPKIFCEYKVSIVVNENVSKAFNWTRGYRVCVPRFATFLQFPGRINLYFGSILWYRALFVHIVPCVLLLIFTWKLVSTIRQADQRRFGTRMTPILTHQHSAVLHSRMMHATTRMLIVVISIFLLIEIPVALIFIFHFLYVMYRLVPNSLHQSLNVLIIFRNIMIIVAYPFNFAIYCGMSEQFRQQFRQLFRQRTLLIPRSTFSNGLSRYSIQLSEASKTADRRVNRQRAASLADSTVTVPLTRSKSHCLNPSGTNIGRTKSSEITYRSAPKVQEADCPDKIEEIELQ